MKHSLIRPLDERRHFVCPGEYEATVAFAVQHWLKVARRALADRGRFVVALSGGSTPRPIYQKLAQESLDWQKVWLFWSDERAVLPTHSDSNYYQAMQSGFLNLPIPFRQIIRMHAEEPLERAAHCYEKQILQLLDSHFFDLVMLGVGEDGHVASLFPNSPALAPTKELVVALDQPPLRRCISLTRVCINQSRLAVIYAFGASKSRIVHDALHAPTESPWPASSIGTSKHPALWIVDRDAAQRINNF